MGAPSRLESIQRSAQKAILELVGSWRLESFSNSPAHPGSAESPGGDTALRRLLSALLPGEPATLLVPRSKDVFRRERGSYPPPSSKLACFHELKSSSISELPEPSGESPLEPPPSPGPGVLTVSALQQGPGWVGWTSHLLNVWEKGLDAFLCRPPDCCGKDAVPIQP